MKKIFYIIIVIIILLFTIFAFSSFREVFDNNDIQTKFSDGGISTNCSNEWYILPNVTKIVSDNGTLLVSDGDRGAYANKPSTNISWFDTYEWSSPFTIEFDVSKWEGQINMRITDNINDASKNFNELGVRNQSHIKIISTTNNITYIVDGKKSDPINISFSNAQIGFQLVNASLEYKNFKIY